MKKFLPFLLLMAFSFGMAQQNLIAVSGQENQKRIVAEDIRFFDSETTKSSTVLEFKEQVNLPKRIAALALDTNENNIVFMEMGSWDIYSFNLNSKKTEQIYKSNNKIGNCSVTEQFSRMTSTPNGAIYAINNNATSVLKIQFNNGRYHIEDLGYVTEKNGARNSLFSKSLGWGGDLVSDDQGNLYLISASANVFYIDSKTLESEHIGVLKNLPKGFATNGAAVNYNGEIVVGNAAGKGFYSFNLDRMTLKPLNQNSFPVYDLASPYFIKTESGINSDDALSMSLYPTRVVDGKINVKSLTSQTTKVQIIDINGKVVMNQKIKTSDRDTPISLDGLTPGYYFVKMNSKNQEEVNKKILIIR